MEVVIMEAKSSSVTVCPVCPHHCHLLEGQVGICRARRNVNGRVIADNYGRITSIALDPIEKKPLARFHPGSLLLSVGSYGCNMQCPFCQNASISTAGSEDVGWEEMTPEALVEQTLLLKSRDSRVIGIAYTYNEPFVSFEFIKDCARLAHVSGLMNVAVTNGMVCEEPLSEVLPFIDAFNVDLKTFDPEVYRSWGGDLDTVKRTIARANDVSHVEVTTLIIPHINDSEEEIDEIVGWLASINPDITYHLSRFFPCYHMADYAPTSVERIHVLAARARQHISHVCEGNC
jgi:pyruvate formate lyase activating enzyme